MEPRHLSLADVLQERASTEVIEELSRANGMLAIDLGGYGGAHSRDHPDSAEQRSPTVLSELVAHFNVVRASLEDCAHLLGAESVATDAGQEGIVQGFLTGAPRSA